MASVRGEKRKWLGQSDEAATNLFPNVTRFAGCAPLALRPESPQLVLRELDLGRSIIGRRLDKAAYALHRSRS